MVFLYYSSLVSKELSSAGNWPATHRRPTGDIATEACFHILFTYLWPTGDELFSVESFKIELKWKSFLVVLKPIKLLKLPATHRRPTAVMFPYKFLEVSGTAMEKKLNKFQLFFDICGRSPVGHRQLKWGISINEFNDAGGSPALESYMETRLYMLQSCGITVKP